MPDPFGLSRPFYSGSLLCGLGATNRDASAATADDRTLNLLLSAATATLGSLSSTNRDASAATADDRTLNLLLSAPTATLGSLSSTDRYTSGASSTYHSALDLLLSAPTATLGSLSSTDRYTSGASSAYHSALDLLLSSTATPATLSSLSSAYRHTSGASSADHSALDLLLSSAATPATLGSLSSAYRYASGASSAYHSALDLLLSSTTTPATLNSLSSAYRRTWAKRSTSATTAATAATFFYQTLVGLGCLFPHDLGAFPSIGFCSNRRCHHYNQQQRHKSSTRQDPQCVPVNCHCLNLPSQFLTGSQFLSVLSLFGILGNIHHFSVHVWHEQCPNCLGTPEGFVNNLRQLNRSNTNVPP